MIYSKKYCTYLVFDLIPGTDLLKPMRFPVIKAMQLTFGKPSGNKKIRAGCQGNQPCEDRVGTFSPPSQTLGRRKRLKVEAITNS